MDDATLVLIADEIALLLRRYLPDGQNVTLRADSTTMKSKSCAQVFAFRPEHGGVFSVNAELRHPPPAPGNLNLKCVAAK
jgi:hypothetical protein